MDPRRLANPAVAVPVRPDAARHQTQFVPADRPLEDSRQSASQFCRADAAPAPRRPVDGPAWPALLGFVANMMASPIIAAVVALLVSIARPEALSSAVPFVGLWAIAPGIAYWLSMPVGPRERPLTNRERLLLRRTARKTWRYFE